MELRQLEAFEAVVSERSFTRASELLHLTQPAVTRQIAALETELHTRLFDRLGRTVALTAAGEALHRYAENILRLTKEAQQIVSDIAIGKTGRLAVGASSTLATYVLPPLLRRFRELHPNVEISVHTGVSAQVLEMIRSNQADIGMVTADVRDEILAARVLAEYETCVVVPPSHPLAKRAEIRASELAGNPLILMEEGTNLRTYVDRLLNAAGVEEQVTMELDNVEAIKRMVEAELGLSMLPQVSVQTEVETGRLVSLKLTDVPQANRQIKVVHRRDKYLSTVLKEFLTLLTENGRK